MPKFDLKRGVTSRRIRLFIQDTSKTDGSGLTGLLYNSSGLTCYYFRDGDTTATVVTLVTATLGTWVSGGFVVVDATNLPGVYEFGVPNAILAAGGDTLIYFKGAANMAPCLAEIELDSVDAQDGVAFGMTRLDTTVSSRSTYAGADTAGTTTLLTRVGQALLYDGSGNVKSAPQTGVNVIQWNSVNVGGMPNSGNVTVGAYAAGQDPGTYVLVTPANKISANASNQVVASSVQGSVTGSVASVTAGVSLATGQNIATIAGQAPPTNFSALAITAGGAVTVGTNSDKTGYSGTATNFTTPPTTAQIAAAILTTPANLLTTDGAGKVGANNLPSDYQQRGVAVTLPAGEDSSIQADVAAALTAQGLTTVRAAKIDNLDTTVSSRSTFSGGAVASVTADVGITQAGADKVWSTLARTLTSASDSSGVTSLLARLTTTRAGNLDNLDAAVSSRSTFSGGAVSSVTGSVGSVSGVTFPTNFGLFSVDTSGRVNLVPGQSTSASNYVAAPTVAQIAAGVLTTPANLIATDSSGRMLLQPTQTGVTIPTVTTVTNSVAAGNLPSDYQQRGVAVTLPTTVLQSADHTAIQGDVTSGLTTQGYTTTRAGFLDTLNGIVAAIWSAATRTLSAFGFTVSTNANATETAIKAKTDQLGFTGANVNANAQVVSDKTSYSGTATNFTPAPTVAQIEAGLERDGGPLANTTSFTSGILNDTTALSLMLGSRTIVALYSAPAGDGKTVVVISPDPQWVNQVLVIPNHGARRITAVDTTLNTLTLSQGYDTTQTYDLGDDCYIYQAAAYEPNASDVAASVWGASTRTLTAASDTSGTTTLLARVPAFPTNFGAFSLDTSGRVTLVPGQSTVASNYVAAPTASAVASAVQALFPADYLSSTEVTELATTITDLNTLLARTDPTTAVAAISSITSAIKTQTDKLTFTGSNVNSAAQNLPSDYQQRGVAVTLPAGEDSSIQSDVAAALTAQGLTSARATKLDNLDAAVSSRSTYAGADTAGTTTLLARVPSFPANFTAFSLDTSGRVTLVPGQATTAPTVSQIAAGILVNPLNLLATDSSGKVGANNLPVEVLSSAEQGQLTAAVSDLVALLGRTDTATTVTSVQTAVNTILSRLPAALSFTGANVNANAQVVADKTNYSGSATNLPSDYAQRGTPPTWYVAPDNADVASLLTDLVSLAARADPTTALGALQTATTAIKAKTDALPAAYPVVDGEGRVTTANPYLAVSASLGSTAPTEVNTEIASSPPVTVLIGGA